MQFSFQNGEIMTAVNNVNPTSTWNVPARIEERGEEGPVHHLANLAFRNRAYGSHYSFRCVENVSFIEAYPITTLFLILMTGGLAILPLALMRGDRIVDRCNFHGHQVRQERVLFMQKHPLTSIFLIAVTGGLALLFLPFATATISKCPQGHHVKSVQQVPFIAEYPITSIFIACFSGGFGIIPLVFMTTAHSSDWQ